MSKSQIVSILSVLLLLGGGIAIYFLKPSVIEDRQFLNGKSTSEINEIPEGWVVYKSDNWRFSVAHPPDWEVMEKKVTEESNAATMARKPIGSLLMVTLAGDGYTVAISRDGRGVGEDSKDTNYTYPEYSIDSIKAKVIEWQTASGFSQYVTVDGDDTYLTFSIFNQTSRSKEITDQILSTVKFL